MRGTFIPTGFRYNKFSIFIIHFTVSFVFRDVKSNIEKLFIICMYALKKHHTNVKCKFLRLEGHTIYMTPIQCSYLFCNIQSMMIVRCYHPFSLNHSLDWWVWRSLKIVSSGFCVGNLQVLSEIKVNLFVNLFIYHETPALKFILLKDYIYHH